MATERRAVNLIEGHFRNMRLAEDSVLSFVHTIKIRKVPGPGIQRFPDPGRNPTGYTEYVFKRVVARVQEMIRPFKDTIVVDHHGDDVLKRLVAELEEMATYNYPMRALSVAEIFSYLHPYMGHETIMDMLELGLDPRLFRLCDPDVKALAVSGSEYVRELQLIRNMLICHVVGCHEQLLQILSDSAQ